MSGRGPPRWHPLAPLGGKRLLPALLPHPPPRTRVATLTETLIKECDGAHSNAVRSGNELMAEREVRRTVEAWAEAFWQKVTEVEEAHWAAKGMVTELRASLSLMETARDAARSELRNA